MKKLAEGLKKAKELNGNSSSDSLPIEPKGEFDTNVKVQVLVDERNKFQEKWQEPTMNVLVQIEVTPFVTEPPGVRDVELATVPTETNEALSSSGQNL